MFQIKGEKSKTHEAGFWSKKMWIFRILVRSFHITFFHHDYIQYYIVLVRFYNLFPPRKWYIVECRSSFMTIWYNTSNEQVLELPLRVTSIHRLDSFKPFFKVEDWTHRRSRFSRSLSLQTNSSVDMDPILTYEIVGGRGGGGGTLRYIWDTTYAMKPDKSRKCICILFSEIEVKIPKATIHRNWKE